MIYFVFFWYILKIQIYSDISIYIQVYSARFRYVQIYSDIFRCIHIYSFIFRYIQTYSDIFRHIQTYSDIFGYIHIYSDTLRYIQPLSFHISLITYILKYISGYENKCFQQSPNSLQFELATFLSSFYKVKFNIKFTKKPKLLLHCRIVELRLHCQDIKWDQGNQGY